MGEGETTDEFTTQMTSDNIPDEDRGEILVRATSSKLMMPWKASSARCLGRHHQHDALEGIISMMPCRVII